jgi:hypothetical protein
MAIRLGLVLAAIAGGAAGFQPDPLPVFGSAALAHDFVFEADPSAQEGTAGVDAMGTVTFSTLLIEAEGSASGSSAPLQLKCPNLIVDETDAGQASSLIRLPMTHEKHGAGSRKSDRASFLVVLSADYDLEIRHRAKGNQSHDDGWKDIRVHRKFHSADDVMGERTVEGSTVHDSACCLADASTRSCLSKIGIHHTQRGDGVNGTAPWSVGRHTSNAASHYLRHVFRATVEALSKRPALKKAKLRRFSPHKNSLSLGGSQLQHFDDPRAGHNASSRAHAGTTLTALTQLYESEEQHTQMSAKVAVGVAHLHSEHHNQLTFMQQATLSLTMVVSDMEDAEYMSATQVIEGIADPIQILAVPVATSATVKAVKPMIAMVMAEIIAAALEDPLCSAFVPIVCPPTILVATESAVGACLGPLQHGLSATLADELFTRVNRTVNRVAARLLTEVLTITLTEGMVKIVVQLLSRTMVRIPAHEVTRAVSPVIVRSVAQSVSQSMNRSPAADYYCYYCEQKKVYCELCEKHENRAYYGQYYTVRVSSGLISFEFEPPSHTTHTLLNGTVVLCQLL